METHLPVARAEGGMWMPHERVNLDPGPPPPDVDLQNRYVWRY
jgi:hypothetical protein